MTGAYGNFISNSNNQLATKTSKTVEDEDLPKNIKMTSTKKQKNNKNIISNADSKPSDETLLLSSDDCMKPTKQQIFKTIQQFLFVFKEKKDKLRFLDLIKFLLHNIEQELSSKVKIVFYWKIILIKLYDDDDYSPVLIWFDSSFQRWSDLCNIIYQCIFCFKFVYSLFI